MGRGALNAAISTLQVSIRRPGVFSHSQPPWKWAEIMFTGARAVMRSSSALSSKACEAPPEAPVHPMRAGSTSSSPAQNSSAIKLFQVCRIKEVNPHRAP